MRKAAVLHNSAPANTGDPQMLVLGYHDTLQPDPTSHAVEALPPQMESLLEPLLAGARLELDRRLPPAQKVLSGEPIPLHLLLKILHLRVQDILTMPLAVQLSTTNTPNELTQDHLTRKYPALAPLLQQTVSEWVASTVTFLARLQRDSSRLAQWLGLARLPPIESVSGTTADTHPGGHVTLRVAFQGGTSIYYKPRAVTGEWLWHSLLESVAAVEPNLRLPAARVLLSSVPSRYGWMESVLSYPSESWDSGSPHYWRSAGAVLCLAYHACLTDLHLDNLIATTNGPGVTDAECLGTPAPYHPPATRTSSNATEFNAILSGLSETGLLPGRASHDLPDISGLFGIAATVPFLRLPRWSASSGEKYRLTTAPATLLHHGNSPTAASPLAVLPHLIDGYHQAAAVLLHTRKTLLASQSPWRFILERDHAPRIVVRDTLSYALLLTRSLDPAHLRSQHRRCSTLRTALQKQTTTGLPYSLLRAELHALLHLHVPRFVMMPGTRNLAAGSGKLLARRFTQNTPLQQVTSRMENLTPGTLEANHIPALIASVLRPYTPSEIG